MRLFGRRKVAAVVPEIVDDGSLVVVATAFDPAASDGRLVSELLLAIGESTPVLVRHHFAGVTVDSYPALVSAVGAADWVAGPLGDDGSVLASSTRVLVPLAASQTRARMAGTAFRLGADHLGWDALRPPPADPA